MEEMNNLSTVELKAIIVDGLKKTNNNPTSCAVEIQDKLSSHDNVVVMAFFNYLRRNKLDINVENLDKYWNSWQSEVRFHNDFVYEIATLGTDEILVQGGQTIRREEDQLVLEIRRLNNPKWFADLVESLGITDNTLWIRKTIEK